MIDPSNHFEELPESHTSTAELERANFILSNLGLSWEQIAGTEVLDVGSGDSELAKAAELQGSTGKITSVDINLQEKWFDFPWGDHKRLVQADAEALPFKDSSFDYVVMHGSVGLAGIPEAVRVLKPGGEMRLYPLGGMLLEFWNMSYYLDQVKGFPQEEVITMMETFSKQIDEADGWLPREYFNLREEALNRLSKEQKLEVIKRLVDRVEEQYGLRFTYRVSAEDSREPDALLIYKKSWI